MANYVHSTASQNMVYPIYSEGQQNQAQVLKKITIRGKANVADSATLMTPTGAVTEVSDEDLALLKKSPAFQRHVQKGFMKVISTSELDTRDMEKRDGSAQLQDAEYADGTVPMETLRGQTGNCRASCGRGDRIKGKKGIAFIDE